MSKCLVCTLSHQLRLPKKPTNNNITEAILYYAHDTQYPLIVQPLMYVLWFC